MAWQRCHGRHDLPWQHTRDPYVVWLSEIMLQQTQVAAAIPYFQRFVERFPDLAALASAPVDDVLALWSGLGYYSRARNLHRAAQVVATAHAGRFPRRMTALLALPGIGRSTAAAIRVFAFGQRAAILDGNVKRVLARVAAIAGYPGDAAVAKRLWHAAEAHLPRRDLRAYTQGLMDLGATVCTRRNPRCDVCPLRAWCAGHRAGIAASLPTSKPRKSPPQRRTTMLILQHGRKLLLERRPDSGVWGGLWCFPETTGSADNAQVQSRFGVRARRIEVLPTVAHGFTHYRLDIVPCRFAALGAPEAAPDTNLRWVTVTAARRMGLPAPVRRLLEALHPVPDC